MIGTSARLLHLLGLLQSRAAWSGQELAGRLAVDARTVRRDVDRLRSLGYSIHSTAGLAGGYQLGAGESIPPLLLTDDEAVTIAISLLSRTLNGDADDAGDASRNELTALAKLEQLLPPRLRKRVRALARATDSLAWGNVPPIQSGILLDLAVACRQHDEILILYRDRVGSLTSRTVEPHRLVSVDRVWYVPCWDHIRQDWRTFRVDRVERIQQSGRRFTPRRLPKDAVTFVSESVSGGSSAADAKFRLHMPIDEAMRRIPARAGRLEPDGKHACFFRVSAKWVGEAAFRLAASEIDFEVLEPPELSAQLQRIGRRLARAAR